jgi:hypothetical protein
MVSSDVWHELAKQFRALPDPAKEMSAFWAELPEKIGNDDTSWSLQSGPETSRTRSVESQFMALAARAGKCLNPPPGCDLSYAWLNAVKNTSIELQKPDGLWEAIDSDRKRGLLPCGTIHAICEESARNCDSFEMCALEVEHFREIDAQSAPPTVVPPETKQATPRRARKRSSVSRLRAERKRLADRYRARFKAKHLILDICWAAQQRYREWKRWINVERDKKTGSILAKDGSKTDRAFRAILTSRKSPRQYRREPRPPKWQ